MSDCFDHGSEAFDRMLDGEDDGYATQFDEGVTCKFCKQEGLDWELNDHCKWQLYDYDKDEWHACWLRRK